MGGYIKGEVVVIPFPFSDLTESKPRPALVISNLQGDDIILCQITSQIKFNDSYWIKLLVDDFSQGQLDRDSYIRTNKLFTADKKIIIKKKGMIKINKVKDVINKLTEIIQN